MAKYTSKHDMRMGLNYLMDMLDQFRIEAGEMNWFSTRDIYIDRQILLRLEKKRWRVKL